MSFPRCKYIFRLLQTTANLSSKVMHSQREKLNFPASPLDLLESIKSIGLVLQTFLLYFIYIYTHVQISIITLFLWLLLIELQMAVAGGRKKKH